MEYTLYGNTITTVNYHLLIIIIIVTIGNSIVLGTISINSLDELSVFNPFNTCTNTCVPSLYDLQDSNDDWDPFYCSNNKIIIINTCDVTGHTCLVFDESKTIIN